MTTGISFQTNRNKETPQKVIVTIINLFTSEWRLIEGREEGKKEEGREGAREEGRKEGREKEGRLITDTYPAGRGSGLSQVVVRVLWST